MSLLHCILFLGGATHSALRLASSNAAFMVTAFAWPIPSIFSKSGMSISINRYKSSLILFMLSRPMSTADFFGVPNPIRIPSNSAFVKLLGPDRCIRSLGLSLISHSFMVRRLVSASVMSVSVISLFSLFSSIVCSVHTMSCQVVNQRVGIHFQHFATKKRYVLIL